MGVPDLMIRPYGDEHAALVTAERSPFALYDKVLRALGVRPALGAALAAWTGQSRGVASLQRMERRPG